jgi:hypothetical protein
MHKGGAEYLTLIRLHAIYSFDMGLGSGSQQKQKGIQDGSPAWRLAIYTWQANQSCAKEYSCEFSIADNLIDP